MGTSINTDTCYEASSRYHVTVSRRIRGSLNMKRTQQRKHCDELRSRSLQRLSSLNASNSSLWKSLLVPCQGKPRPVGTTMYSDSVSQISCRHLLHSCTFLAGLTCQRVCKRFYQTVSDLFLPYLQVSILILRREGQSFSSLPPFSQTGTVRLRQPFRADFSSLQT